MTEALGSDIRKCWRRNFDSASSK